MQNKIYKVWIKAACAHLIHIPFFYTQFASMHENGNVF